MKYLFTLFILFYSLALYGQKIHFSDTANNWRFLYSVVNWPDKSYSVATYKYKGSLEQNGAVYYILSNGSDSAHIREDSVNKRIYAKVYSNQYLSNTDTNEHLLYDFGLIIGDTFKVQTSAYSTSYVITAIDSTNIGGTWHKVFNLEVPQPYYSLTVIEGIGCIRDPFLPLFGNFFEENRELICYSNNNNYPVLNPAVIFFDNNTSCKDTALKVPDVQVTRNLMVYPQPACTQAIIKIPGKLINGRLYLYTVDGHELLEQPVQNKDEIQIPKPLSNSNLYFYKLTDVTGGKIYIGKISFD